jgi:hypothetical protein
MCYVEMSLRGSTYLPIKQRGNLSFVILSENSLQP